MRAYRITAIKTPTDDRAEILDGTGAATHGARWNSPGRRVIYAAEHFSLAMLEVMVNANEPMPPRQYAEISIPEDVKTEEVKIENLPAGWDSIPYGSASQEYGDRWYDEKRTAVLLVPSVVCPVERNVVINQEHPDFQRIKHNPPQEVRWDRRLFKVDV